MEIHQRIKECRVLAKKSVQDVADHLSVSYEAARLWELPKSKKGTIPRGKKLIGLAKFIKSTPEFLLYGSDPGHLAPDEQELLKLYNKLTPKNKSMVLDAVRFIRMTAFGGDWESYEKWEKSQDKLAKDRAIKPDI